MLVQNAPSPVAKDPPAPPHYFAPHNILMLILLVLSFAAAEFAVAYIGMSAALAGVFLGAIGFVLILRRSYVPGFIAWGLAVAFQVYAPAALDLTAATPDQLRFSLTGHWYGDKVELDLNPDGTYSAAGTAWDQSLGVSGTWWVDRNQLILRHEPALHPSTSTVSAHKTPPVTCRLSLRKLSRSECEIQSLAPMYSHAHMEFSTLTRFFNFSS